MKSYRSILSIIVLFTLCACTFVPEAPYTPPVNTNDSIYINEPFDESFGVFTSVVTHGNSPWTIDNKAAQVTSYDENGENLATSWLISSKIDFTDETEAHISFEYIILNSDTANIAKHHQLLISSDYDGDATTAIWFDIPYNAIESDNYNTFHKADVAIPAEYMYKNNVVVALRYTANTESSTWRVKNFKLAKGTPENESKDDNEENEGNGDEENKDDEGNVDNDDDENEDNEENDQPDEVPEYSVAEAIDAFSKDKTGRVIVKGYIVGTVKDHYDNCIFSNNTTVDSNILIADDANETDSERCIPVMLSDEEMRKNINLKKNPQNYRREITVAGELTLYLGVAGIKNMTEYTLGNTLPPDTPDTPDTPETPNTPNTPDTPETPDTPDTPDEPDTPDTPNKPDIPALPEGEDIISNGSFEEWDNGNPAGWATFTESNSATISPSDDAFEGNSSVMIEGYSGMKKNKVLYSRYYKLKPGTYNLIVHVKANGEEFGYCRIGYCYASPDDLIKEYQYEDREASAVTDNWEQRKYQFTVDRTKYISLIIVNHKNGGGASFLVDNVSLITADGGIVTK